MLDIFRNSAKSWVVKLLFGLLALSFVAWGVGDLRGSMFGRGPAIEVGGNAISANEVQDEFKREIARLQPLFGGKLTSEDARKMGLLDRTIQTIVTRTLIDEAAKRLGLSASKDAVIAQVAADPGFRNETGQFDRELLRRALSRANMSEEDYMRAEMSNMVRAQMAEALAGGLVAPAVLADPLAEWREERRIAETVSVADEAVPLPAAPDQSTMEQYYKANSDRFMAPEYRALTVLRLKPSDVSDRVQITEQQIADAYQTRLEEFVTPDRRPVKQVVLADQATATRAGDMVKAGKDLAAIAKDVGVSVVDLGMVSKGELPEELADSVFAQAAGTLSPPTQTALGWHITQAGLMASGKTRPLTEVKSLVEQDLRREQAGDLLMQVANQVEDTLGSGATLEEAANRLHLKTIRIAAIDAQGKAPDGTAVADAPKGETFLDVAFHTEPGTESQLTDQDGDGYFLLRVDQITPPQPRALTDVRAQVIAGWQAEQRHEKAGDLAKSLAKRLTDGDAMAKVAQSHGLKIVQTAAFTRDGAEKVKLSPSLVSEMFKGKVGAVAVTDDKKAWTIARLAKIEVFDPAKDAKATQTARHRVSSAVATDLVDQYLAALNAELGVRIDRSQLAREE